MEALRLGLGSFASDLHPTPVLALRAMLEYLPGRPDLVDRFEAISAEVEAEIRERIAPLYGDADGQPLAFFWARTYECPACDATSPLFRDRWLARARRRVVVEAGYDLDGELVSEIRELGTDSEASAGAGNLTRQGARCLRCDALSSTAELRSQGVAGRLGDWLYAKLIRDEEGSKRYEAATPADAALAEAAMPRWTHSARVPATPLDPNGIRHTWAMQYGVATISDLYTPRQAQALDDTLGILIEARDRRDGADAPGLASLLCLAFNRLLPYSSRHTWWQASGQFPANMYSRQAIPMVWDYVEMPLSSPGAAGWESAVRWVSMAARNLSGLPGRGRVARTDAAETPLQDASVDLVAIDPPYFDSVAYSYLSEPFVAWSYDLVEPFLGAEAAPADVSTHEAIVDRRHSLAPAPKDRAHFTRKMTEAFAEAARVLRPDGLLMVMYGHKELAAWESVLEAAASSGFAMTSSWPLRTERKAKFRHSHVNALGGSCLLTFRNSAAGRPELGYDALVGSLEGKLAEKQSEYVAHGVDGPDLASALTVLSMGFFMSHRVRRDDGQEVSLQEFVAEIPSLLARTQLRLALGDPLLADLHPLLREGGFAGHVSGDSPAGPVAELAARYLVLARAEEWDDLDALLLLGGDAGQHGDALALLRYTALSEDSSSPLRRSAEIVLGRAALRSAAWRSEREDSAGRPGLEVEEPTHPDPGAGQPRDESLV